MMKLTFLLHPSRGSLAARRADRRDQDIRHPGGSARRPRPGGGRRIEALRTVLGPGSAEVVRNR